MACNVLMMGPPGSGKGTQAARIAERRGLAHISTGDMLRAAMHAGSDLGNRVRNIVERGDLVPDELMLELVLERLGQPDTEGGFLLDGFPRTVAQAEALLTSLPPERPLHCVVLLTVDDTELVRRALGRGRTDDAEETIRHRLSVYLEQTRPVLKALEGKVRQVEIDGVGDVEEITTRIEQGLDASDPPQV